MISRVVERLGHYDRLHVAQNVVGCDRECGITFWHSVVGPQVLPDSFVIGISSAARLGVEVCLATYQPLTNAPEGIRYFAKC